MSQGASSVSIMSQGASSVSVMTNIHLLTFDFLTVKFHMADIALLIVSSTYMSVHDACRGKNTLGTIHILIEHDLIK